MEFYHYLGIALKAMPYLMNALGKRGHINNMLSSHNIRQRDSLLVMLAGVSITLILHHFSM